MEGGLLECTDTETPEPSVCMEPVPGTVPSDAGLPSSPTVPSDARLPSSPTGRGMERVLVESTDTDTDTEPPEPSLSLRGCRSHSEDESDADSSGPIAKRVRNEPRTRHPSMLQISPYVNPVTKVYKSRKQAESHPLTEAPAPATMEGQGGRDGTEVRICYE